MKITKIKWAMRSLCYSFVCKIKFPSYIGKPIYVSNISKIKLEKRVRIYPGLRFEAIGKKSALIVGENTSIGQNFHVVSYNEPIIIGSNVTISGNVFVSNCSHQYSEIGKSVLEQDISGQKTKISDNCFIGYGAVIQSGTILGKQCIVGSNAVLKGTYPDFSVVVGVPGRVIKKYDMEKGKWIRV